MRNEDLMAMAPMAADMEEILPSHAIPSWNALPEVEEILKEYRVLAYDALADVMLDAFEEIGKALKEGQGLSGFSAKDVARIVEHSRQNDLAEWLTTMDEGARDRLVECFLDLGRRRMKAFRDRYPQSFMKWTGEEDSDLLAMYAAGAGWAEMSAHFGRNTNALKLRLGKLGIDLGPDAGKPRFAR